MNKLSSLTCLALLLVLGCQKPSTEPELPVFPDGLIPNENGNANFLKAIGQYSGSSSCTAIFVRLSDNPDAPAYVLTNGHCVQNWDANAVHVNEPVNHTVSFNVFKNTPDSARINVEAKQIAYSTMKGTDLAIVALNATVQQLIDRGVNPIPIAKAVPAPGTPIQIFGIPVDNIPPGEQQLRRTSGTLGQRIDKVLEFTWTWFDLYANDAPGISGGNSGSPVFGRLADGVFALINTTAPAGSSPCYLGAPCETTPTGTTYRPGVNYAPTVLTVPGCVNASGQFDLNAPDCQLDKGRNAVVKGYPAGATNPQSPSLDGRPVQQTWNTTVSGFSHYRYKIGPASTLDPRDPAGYSAVRPAGTLIGDSLPKAAGQYMLAVVGGNSPTFDASWQQPKYATVARVEIDKTAPTKEPIVSIRELDDVYVVSLGFSPPELSDYVFKFGPPDSTDAGNMKDFMRYRRIPFDIPKGKSTKLVVIGYDAASNATAPYVKLFP